MSKFRRAIVVGASSGIGYELVRQLAEAGTQVVALARREAPLQELAASHPGLVHAMVHDVLDTDSIPAKFIQACDLLGGLDLIIYSSGVLHRVERDEYDFQKDQEMLRVNVEGGVAWLNQAAMRFAGQGSGCIVGIGSVAGDRGRANAPIYNASKACFHTYLESLRNRLSQHNVTVTTIKPGPVDTPMTAGMSFSKALTAEDAARRILRAAGRNAEVYLVPLHAVAFRVLRAIPSPIFRRLKL